jgi:hypothetical protein
VQIWIFELALATATETPPKPSRAPPSVTRCAPRPRFARSAVLASSGTGGARSPFESARNVERVTERWPCPSPGRAGLGASASATRSRPVDCGRSRLPSVERARAGGRARRAGRRPAREGRAPEPSDQWERGEKRRRMGRREAHATRLTGTRFLADSKGESARASEVSLLSQFPKKRENTEESKRPPTAPQSSAGSDSPAPSVGAGLAFIPSSSA